MQKEKHWMHAKRRTQKFKVFLCPSGARELALDITIASLAFA
jgi:hypothetical protein